MASVVQLLPPVVPTNNKLFGYRKPYQRCNVYLKRIQPMPVLCASTSAWEQTPVKYAPTDSNTKGEFLKGTTTIFETLTSQEKDEASQTNSIEATDVSNQSVQILNLKWPMWLLGPVFLVATGMAPTLWLPTSTIFLGPNIASLLSLTGLDCIFHLGASIFLLLADSCSRPKDPTEVCHSQAPLSYKFWNILASTTGYLIPLAVLFLSQNVVSFQPNVPLMSFSILFGPYLLLLSIQMLVEMLTWHWRSPVWLVTPVVYEAYRVLQLMRALKLGAELSVPVWMLDTVRVLVCWWIMVLGVQLMRVAWYAGFTARASQQQQ
ncbi:uncharacterized protein LOC124938006 [Impatiens glandulifera]|uniref:uncharacterized protein LOC124938006 n=1 Tax=Impatiens glandulifera TaxID=253017 RepID=UPI001FB159C9|nr:uncharacterized protein LOC124938006 [Impatiens glandulifera]XP_047334317.1 uncharacterized protein LOC124938006 [Impatiens glandulifera]